MWLVAVDVGTPQILTIKNAYNNQWHSFNIAAKPKKKKKEKRFVTRSTAREMFWLVDIGMCVFCV